MFIQALVRYADQHLQSILQDESFVNEGVPFILALGEDGTPDRVIKHTVKTAKKERAKQVSVCRLPTARSSNILPRLAADNVYYMVGPHEAWTPEGKEERQQKAFEAARELAQEADLDVLQPYLKFLQHPDKLARGRELLAEAGLTAGNLAIADAKGNLAVLDQTLRDWWAGYFAKEAEKDSKEEMYCCVTGKLVKPCRLHTKSIQGVPGTNPSGARLISFNKPSFEHHGWKQSENAPMSRETASAYTTALDYLLQPDQHPVGPDSEIQVRTRFNFGADDVVHVLWLEPAAGDVIELLQDGGGLVLAENIRRCLQGDDQLPPDQRQYHCLMLRGNSGRIAVQDYQHGPVTELEQRLEQWAELVSFETMRGREALPLWRLSAALERTGMKSGRNTLIRRAVCGERLPYYAIQVLREWVHKGRDKDKKNLRVRPETLALGKIIYADRGEGTVQDSAMYHLGFVLADLEDMQWKSCDRNGQRPPTKRLSDGHFTIFMTRPAWGLARVQRLARAHYNKLYRSHPALALHVQKKIERSLERIRDLGGLPDFALPEQQTAFVIGYNVAQPQRMRENIAAAAKRAGLSVEEYLERKAEERKEEEAESTE